MIWAIAIALAAAVFAALAFGLRIPNAGWAAVAATLAFGLAGYAMQASPNIPGAPAASIDKPASDGTALVEVRRRIMGREDQPVPPYILTADAFARRGQYSDAAGLLRSAVREHPNDAEAWLALGNALVEHSDGALSPPALYAYRQADAAEPDGAGAAFFLGLAQIRQGEVIEAHRLWSAKLAAMPEGAPGREELATRFTMLDAAMRQVAAEAAQGAGAQSPHSETSGDEPAATQQAPGTPSR